MHCQPLWRPKYDAPLFALCNNFSDYIFLIANSPNCCSGPKYDKPETCPSSGVAYYSYFKGSCPKAYAYAYDEASMSSLFTCDSGLKADYTLTFCP